jgi:hypothetical protein
MCLAERERTEKEVWSSVRKAFKSCKDTFLIWLRSLSNFLKELEDFEDDFGKDLKPEVVLPLIKIF